jgi:hypothetical protein
VELRGFFDGTLWNGSGMGVEWEWNRRGAETEKCGSPKQLDRSLAPPVMGCEMATASLVGQGRARPLDHQLNSCKKVATAFGQRPNSLPKF